MRGFRLLPFIALFACLADSCRDEPTTALKERTLPIEKVNAVKEYFTDKGWAYPLQIEPLDSLTIRYMMKTMIRKY